MDTPGRKPGQRTYKPMARTLTAPQIVAALDAAEEQAADGSGRVDLPPSRYIPRGIANHFMPAPHGALYRRLDALLERLHGEYAKGRRVYDDWERILTEGAKLYRDEVDPNLAKECWLTAIQAFGTISMANALTAIPLQVVRGWRMSDPHFVQNLADANDLFFGKVEHKTLERALSDRDPAGAISAMFELKAHNPGRFRENAPIPQPAPPAVSVNIGITNPYLELRNRTQNGPPALPAPTVIDVQSEPESDD